MSGSLTECADTDRQSWNAAFRALGLRWDWSWDTYAELRRHGSERDLAQRFSQFIGEEVDTDKINDMYERCFQARFSGDVGLRQGVAELLKWTVRQSFGLAFVSRYGPGVVRPLLAATARARGGIVFDAVVTGSADIRQDTPSRCDRTGDVRAWCGRGDGDCGHASGRSGWS